MQQSLLNIVRELFRTIVNQDFNDFDLARAYKTFITSKHYSFRQSVLSATLHCSQSPHHIIPSCTIDIYNLKSCALGMPGWEFKIFDRLWGIHFTNLLSHRWATVTTWLMSIATPCSCRYHRTVSHLAWANSYSHCPQEYNACWASFSWGMTYMCDEFCAFFIKFVHFVLINSDLDSSRFSHF
jgi:hypothetical protein